MRVGREVERWQSADGKHLLRIFRRDSHFYFTEISELTQNNEAFWTPTTDSIPYESLEIARREAIAMLTWMKDAV
jgi:hypothetical protein